MDYVVGAGLALGVGVFGSLSGFDRDRAFYPAMLVVIALYYDLFAVMGGGDAVGAEVVATAVLVAASVVGFRTNLWLVAAALVGHGVFDLVHGGLVANAGVPGWWPGFCLSFDVVAGGYLAWLLSTAQVKAARAPGFGARIRPHVDAELAAARAAEALGNADAAFVHLERAHVLGQASTVEHVRVHARMLGWGVRQRRPREIAGQLTRMIGALAVTAVGLIPKGNTGGANVGPFTPMAIPDDLAATIASARTKVGTLLSVAIVMVMLCGPVACTTAPAIIQAGAQASAPQTEYRVLGSGKPVVVMLSGLGFGMDTFDGVAAEIAKSATVIVYDRAGYGGSAVAEGPRDAAAAERELLALLKQTGVAGPYVLAGHSLGGLFAEYFAAKHPDLVAGLILEESRPADFASRCVAAGLSMCSPLPSMMKSAAQGAQGEVAVLTQTEAQVRALDPIKGKPVLVLSRPVSSDTATFAGQWSIAQDELAKRYPGSVHLVAGAGGHDIHHDQRDWYVKSLKAFLHELQ